MTAHSPPFNTYSVSWRVGKQVFTDTPTDLRYRTEDLVKVAYPLPANIGTGGFTSLKLPSGLSLHHSEFSFNCATNVSPASAVVELDLKEPCLLVCHVLVGALHRHDALNGTTHRIEPGSTLLQWVTKTNAELVFDRVAQIEALAVHASQSSLNVLLGEQLASHLRYCLQTSGDLHALPATVTTPLKFCFDGRLEGPLHKLHAQNKTLEFLEKLIRYFDELGVQRLTEQPVSLATIVEYIKGRAGRLPPASRLATLFGLPISTMNNLFVSEFGMSLAAFMKEQRMAHAHELLNGTDLPVSEIAAKLGYSHVGNFSAAFKTFYGYSPTLLRKSVLSDEY